MAGAVAAAGAACAGTTRVAGAACAGRITPVEAAGEREPEEPGRSTAADGNGTARGTLEMSLPADDRGATEGDDVDADGSGSSSDDGESGDGESLVTDAWRPRAVEELRSALPEPTATEEVGLGRTPDRVPDGVAALIGPEGVAVESAVS